MKPSVTTKINRFFAEYPVRRFSRGEIILSPDGTVPPIVYVVRGKVAQYDLSDSGNKTTLSVFHTPAFFPMMNAINELPNTLYYEAISDVRVRIAPRDETIAFLKENPDVMYDLLGRVFSGLSGLLGKISQLMAGTAGSRLLHEISLQATRFGEAQEDGGVLIHVTEIQLAQQTGLARETVSRELQKLKKDGHIALSKGKIILYTSKSPDIPQ